MLLRRITKHVKDQNWFAVFLDFIIVVAGVFIGIQVANWNEAHSVRKEQRVMLEQLHDDLAPRIEYWREGNERLTNTNDPNERFVIDVLKNGQLLDEEVERFNAGLISLIDWYSIDVSLLQRRIESTEIFSEFQGTAYEPILVELHRLWARSENHIRENEARGHHARDVVYSRVFMEPGQYKAPKTIEITPKYDFTLLHKDKEFMHAVAQLYYYNNRARSHVYQTFLGIEEIVKQLKSENIYE